MITEHPAITKGYVERGETITGSDGIQRIKYVIHHSRDYEIVVSVDKEQEFLDEEDRYGTEMAASKARMEKGYDHPCKSCKQYGTRSLEWIPIFVSTCHGSNLSKDFWEHLKKTQICPYKEMDDFKE